MYYFRGGGDGVSPKLVLPSAGRHPMRRRRRRARILITSRFAMAAASPGRLFRDNNINLPSLLPFSIRIPLSPLYAPPSVVPSPYTPTTLPTHTHTHFVYSRQPSPKGIIVVVIITASAATSKIITIIQREKSQKIIINERKNKKKNKKHRRLVVVVFIIVRAFIFFFFFLSKREKINNNRVRKKQFIVR